MDYLLYILGAYWVVGVLGLVALTLFEYRQHKRTVAWLNANLYKRGRQ